MEFVVKKFCLGVHPSPSADDDSTVQTPRVKALVQVIWPFGSNEVIWKSLPAAEARIGLISQSQNNLLKHAILTAGQPDIASSRRQGVAGPSESIHALAQVSSANADCQ